MPTYNFKNTETGEEWEEFFTISGKEEFLKENDHIQQLPSLFSMSASGTGDRIKNDGGWKDNMSRIAEAHPRQSIVRSVMVRNTTKNINTRNVLKKHGRI